MSEDIPGKVRKRFYFSLQSLMLVVADCATVFGLVRGLGVAAIIPLVPFFFTLWVWLGMPAARRRPN